MIQTDQTKSSTLHLSIRALYTLIEHNIADESEIPLRKVAAVAVVKNPYAGRYVESLGPLVEASAKLGNELAQIAVGALSPFLAQSYGKAAIVGFGGEQEHANAVLTTTFADPLRNAIGGGKAWISSFTKRGGPGTSIDIPLASKDALYVRSHYDGMTITLHDAPNLDEIAVIICLANRGRLRARVGGLKLDQISEKNGLC